MSVAKFLVDVIGICFEIYLSIIFYNIFWELKSLKIRFFTIGFSSIAVLNILVNTFSDNALLLPSIFLIASFVLALFFHANLVSRILFVVILTALMAISELIVGVPMVWILDISVLYIQGNVFLYTVGMVASKLVAFILIYFVKLIIPANRHSIDKWFNLSMLILPINSLLLCFLVYEIVIFVGDDTINSLNMIALLISLLLLVIAVPLIRKYLKGMEYKQQYELTMSRLKAQIEHYEQLYSAVDEIKRMKHDMKNTSIALVGLLKNQEVQKAIDVIEKMQSSIHIYNQIINTGFPAIDAIVNAKKHEALKHEIDIILKVIIEDDLHIDELDVALILANALDNATDAVRKSANIDTNIHVLIAVKSNCISIIVENYTSEAPDKNFRTTKLDKATHGFGISQMRTIAEKYHGNLTIDFDGSTQKFSLKVFL
jgi:hypothetical protein